MHLFRRTNNRIHRTSLNAFCAPNTSRFIDYYHLSYNLGIGWAQQRRTGATE